jgi:hypothetical protein
LLKVGDELKIKDRIKGNKKLINKILKFNNKFNNLKNKKLKLIKVNHLL